MEHLLFHDNVLLIFHTFRSTVLCFHKKQCSRKEEKYDCGYPDVYTPNNESNKKEVFSDDWITVLEQDRKSVV